MSEKLLREIVYTTNADGATVIDEANSFDFTPYMRSYQVEYADMDASNERTASGKSVRDFIRTIVTVRCTFKAMKENEASALLQILNKKQLKVAYFDTVTGSYSEEGGRLLFVYPSVTRSTSLYGVNPNVIYNEISADFIEF